MISSVAPYYCVEKRIFGFGVLRNDLYICTCRYRVDAERIVQCLRYVEGIEAAEQWRRRRIPEPDAWDIAMHETGGPPS